MANILNWASVEILEVQEDEHDRIITAKHIAQPKACPQCGTYAAKMYRHGTRTQQVMDTPSHGKRVGVMLER